MVAAGVFSYYKGPEYQEVLRDDLSSAELEMLRYTIRGLYKNMMPKVKISPDYFKLMESSEGAVIYCSIVSDTEAYFYFVEKGGYSGNIMATSGIKKDETGIKTGEESQSYTYDGYGRISELTDNSGNYKKFTYVSPSYYNSLDKVANVEFGNKDGKLYSIDNEYNETYALYNEIYTLNENDNKSIRLSKKTVKDKAGKEIKSEVYSYNKFIQGVSNNNNKLESITSYEGKVEDNKAKNKIAFTYDTTKSDNPLKELTIYDSDLTTVKYKKMYSYQDGTGLMENAIDGNGNQVDFGYDYLGRNNLITFADDTEVNYVFKDIDGYYIREIKANKDATDYLQKERINYFDAKIDSVNYYLRENNDDKLKTKSFTYDRAERRVGEKDLNGNEYKYVYQNDFLKEIINPDNTKKRVSYRVVRLENEAMLETVNTDESGKITYNIKDVYGNERASMLKINGKTTGKYIVYDGRNLPVEIYESVIFTYTEGDINISKPGSYELTNKTEAIKTVIEYDGTGRAVKKIYKEREFEKSKTKCDLTEAYDYDIFNNVISKSLYKGISTTPYFTESYTYDGAGNIIKKTESADGKSLITTAIYDLTGNITQVTYASGVIKKYIYDARNRVIEEIDNSTALNDDKRNVVFYEYDKMGKVVAKYDKRAAKKDVTDKYIYNDKTGYQYNSDVNNSSYGIKNEYDTLGRLKKVIYPDGKSETASYDDNGNVTNVTNKFGGITNYYYDKLNRKIFESAINGENRDYTASFMVYNDNGTVLEKGLSKGITDANLICPTDITGTISILSKDLSKVIVYQYNDANLVESMLVPESGYTNYTYYDDMKLKSKSMKSGAKEEYTYYNTGKVLESKITFGADNILQKTSYEYDENGNVTKYFASKDDTPIKSYEYNGRGMVTKETDDKNRVKSFTYNDTNMLETITYPDGRIESYTYDDDSSLKSRSISSGTWSNTETYAYKPILNTIESISTSDTNTGSLTESYKYDMYGYLYDYNVTGNVTYNSKFIHDYNKGDDYIKYPDSGYIKYDRDNFGRAESISNAYTLKYENGQIASLSSVTGETTSYTYDILERIKEQKTTDKSGSEIFKTVNNYGSLNTDNLVNQEVSIGSDKKTFHYSYDNAERLNSYEINGILYNEELYKYETGYSENKNSRKVYKSDYINLNDNEKINRDWLVRKDITELEGDDVRIDRSAGSLEIVYKEKQYNIKCISIKASKDKSYVNSDKTVKKGWLDIYTADDETYFFKVERTDYDTTYDSTEKRYVVVFKDDKMIAGVRIKIHFYRDDIDPLAYYYNTNYIPKSIDKTKFESDVLGKIVLEPNKTLIGTYYILDDSKKYYCLKDNLTQNDFDKISVILNSIEFKKTPYSDPKKTTTEGVINREDAGYNLSDDTTKGIRGRISDVVKVLALKTAIKDNYEYDSGDRRTKTDTENPTFDNQRVVTNGDKSYRYDNMGRRIITVSRDGTYIYRYDLNGRLWKVYYSYKRLANIGTITDFDNIADTYNYITNGFTLIEENKYNSSGELIYQDTNNGIDIYYRTPWGYLGKKNLTTNKTRYLINYLSSSNGMTADFESAKTDLSGYKSGMSSYNGSGFGMERGANNQKVPVTIDGQPLGELKTFPTGVENAMKLKDYDGNSIAATEKISVVTTFTAVNVINYYRDQIGSIRAVTETNVSNVTTIKWSGDFTPYGQMLTKDYTNQWLPLKTFALHEYDKVIKLTYMNQRWYDSDTGNFISEDPAKSGVNYYGYCGGNPVNFVDPLGLKGGYFGTRSSEDAASGTWRNSDGTVYYQEPGRGGSGGNADTYGYYNDARWGNTSQFGKLFALESYYASGRDNELSRGISRILNSPFTLSVGDIILDNLVKSDISINTKSSIEMIEPLGAIGGEMGSEFNININSTLFSDLFKDSNAIYLNESTAVGGFGHSGWMVKDNNNDWWYLSVDGTKFPGKNKITERYSQLIKTIEGFNKSNDPVAFMKTGIAKKYDRASFFNSNDVETMIIAGKSRVNRNYAIVGLAPWFDSFNCSNFAWYVGTAGGINMGKYTSAVIPTPYGLLNGIIPNKQYNHLKSINPDNSYNLWRP